MPNSGRSLRASVTRGVPPVDVESAASEKYSVRSYCPFTVNPPRLPVTAPLYVRVLFEAS